MPTPISLIQMPNDAMGKILEKCDYRSILVLRKVCHDLRNFIDDVKPDANLTKMVIFVEPNSIAFHLNSDHFEDSKDCEDGEESEYCEDQMWMLLSNSVNIEYFEHTNGCLVRCNKKETLRANENFVSVFCKDFETVMKHQKSLLHYFRFSFQYENDEEKRIIEQMIAKPLLQNFEKCLKSRNLPLKIKHIMMGYDAIMFILPYIDSNLLKIIKIRQPMKTDEALDLEEVGKLDQWKNADQLEFQQSIVTASIRNFIHFSIVNVAFQTISSEDLLFLKEEFVRNSHMRFFALHCTDLVTENLLESLGPPARAVDLHGIADRTWIFEIPDAGKVATVGCRLGFITFHRAHLSLFGRNSDDDDSDDNDSDDDDSDDNDSDDDDSDDNDPDDDRQPYRDYWDDDVDDRRPERDLLDDFIYDDY